MRFFELITLTVRVRTVADALVRIETALAKPEVGGALMGCWASEIGQLNQITVLRGYEDESLRQAERERFLLGGEVFGVGELITDLRIENYTLFPFLKPLHAGQHGPFYEMRVYDLISSGLKPTLDGWSKAIEARTAEQYSPVYAAFYATDGSLPRYLHIWPWATLEERLQVRTQAVADGVWPPENSGPQLQDMCSTIYLPAKFSPLQ
ncbi:MULTISPECIES: NIPSNAP family protein [unclassified Pseudomonas]|uniref:NIPSNAP family protein n=1 Tax=unclassified Pseudomonas TaxID=196821 RepID=UPI000BA320E1|nr:MULTISPECIES: NIPSNAP family protein [unclassified Pseudomonas]MDN4547319.1 NIPSNAP family protein [Pseudomonas sp. C32]